MTYSELSNKNEDHVHDCVSPCTYQHLLCSSKRDQWYVANASIYQHNLLQFTKLVTIRIADLVPFVLSKLFT